MKFEVDKQTLKDLEIFDTIKNDKSVFGLFDFTQCLGGKKKLYNYLLSPLVDLDEIIERKEAIKFFQKDIQLRPNIDKNALDFAEYYLRQANHPTRLPSKFTAIERRLMDKISPSHEYYLIEKGVNSTLDLLKSIYTFSLILTKELKGNCFSKLLLIKSEKVIQLLSQSEYEDIIKLEKPKAYDIAKLDYVFRYTNKKDILFFLDLIYDYDALCAIAKAANIHKFTYPELLPKAENCLEIDGLFHPFVENGISNDIHFSRSSNLLFVSGPNMAGKSTFLKALGIAVYLAHVGFPVPAQKMKLSILSGLCSTINISDSLSSGYSHFYAEVMRVKYVAKKLHENDNMLVLFDELFRGTNVKDAYDGTLEVVSAFAQITNSFFVISSHIVEVAKELEIKKNIKFCYFEIQEQNGHPVYTYKLKEGVSDTRLGMYIIRKEGLIELINDINKNETI